MPEGWNQSPDALNADATTRADLEHVANARLQAGHRIDPADALTANIDPMETSASKEPDIAVAPKQTSSQGNDANEKSQNEAARPGSLVSGGRTKLRRKIIDWHKKSQPVSGKILSVLVKYAKAIGPGFMVAVAYIDPGKSSSWHQL